MNNAQLRSFLRPIVSEFKDLCTGKSMPEFCQGIGLPYPPEGLTKRDRMEGAFDNLDDADLEAFAQRLIDEGHITGGARNQLQELMWEGRAWPEIPKRLRREIARAIDSLGLYADRKRFDALLNSLFDIPSDPYSEIFGGPPKQGLKYEIYQHLYRNDDWSAEQLFDALGAFEVSDRRFALFVEGLSSADVRQEVEDQRSFVDRLNPLLKGFGLEFRETDTDGGYPVFEILSQHASRGKPKNLIFASSVKPDIRFSDAVDNDIEIVANAADVLVYDRPIGSGGLLWRDLQTWWSESQGLNDPTQAKETLYQRLMDSLPADSPPQRRLFKAYFGAFKSLIPGLPALLPEVWLHWDPKTVRERGVRALLSHRMDFLLLLPGGVRIVIEVDGQQHYSRDGAADPYRYAKMAAADRQLKLARYEVFRFGAVELQADGSSAMVKAFFEALFVRFGVQSAQ